ncbi:FACT complex subunit [Binucleata daphniae]
MDIIQIDDLFIATDGKMEDITLKLASQGLALKYKLNGNVQTLKKEEIKEVELFRGVNKFNMRIRANNMININNISEHRIDEIKQFCSKHYDITVFQKDLEIEETNKGKLMISGDFLEFKNNKTIFDVPLKDIENVCAVKNEITFTFKEQKDSVIELKFVSDNVNIVDEIKERNELVKSNEITTFEALQSLVPRGKNNYMFYDNHLKMVGSTYEHKILYSNVKQLFYLKKENNEYYLAIETDPPIRQGQTRYSFIVMILKDVEDEIKLNLSAEIKIKFPELKDEYTGCVGKSFYEVIKAFARPKISTVGSFTTLNNGKSLRCSLKALDGHLYPLDDSMIFMPKAIYMPLREIHNAEFSRVDVSKFAAKTFDMKITTSEKDYMFTSLPKEDFGQLEQYFTEKNIKITSEVIAEEVSYSSEEDAEDDDYSEDD